MDILADEEENRSEKTNFTEDKGLKQSGPFPDNDQKQIKNRQNEALVGCGYWTYNLHKRSAVYGSGQEVIEVQDNRNKITVGC